MTPPKSTVEAPARPTRGGAVAAEPEPPTDGNVDKIREILFGGQMHDYELRFTALENRLEAAAAELREETRSRLEALEAYTKKQLAALGERLAAERRERAEAIAAAIAEAAATGTAIEQRLDLLDERTASGDSDLREQLLEQSKSLSDDLRRVQRSLAERLDEETRLLRATKTDRSTLATLLSDVAVSLSEADRGEDGTT